MNINARLICRFTSKMMRLQFTHLYQLIISLHLCLHLDFSEISVSTVIFLFIRLLCALSPASVTSVTVASESNCATDIDETVMRQSNASCGCFKHTACSIIIQCVNPHISYINIQSSYRTFNCLRAYAVAALASIVH